MKQICVNHCSRSISDTYAGWHVWRLEWFFSLCRSTTKSVPIWFSVLSLTLFYFAIGVWNVDIPNIFIRPWLFKGWINHYPCTWQLYVQGFIKCEQPTKKMATSSIEPPTFPANGRWGSHSIAKLLTFTS